MTILVYEFNNWRNATDNEINCFNNFTNTNILTPEYKTMISGNYTLHRESPNHITLINDKPIINYHNIKVFLPEFNGWVNAREYQKLAYMDYIIGDIHSKYYHSKHSKHILDPESIELQLNLEPNICFKMSRNENGTIYYEKNNITKTNVKISDHIGYQNYYLGFYNRIMDVNYL